MLEIFNSIVPFRAAITDKEMVIGEIDSRLKNQGRIAMEFVLTRCASMGINRDWAKSVILNHMECVSCESPNQLIVNSMNGSEKGQIESWRKGEQLEIPSPCKNCKSSPMYSDICCPLLYGRQLECDLLKEGVVVDGKNYASLVINIGDGPLLSSLNLLATRKNTAVLTIDPKVKYGKQMLGYTLENNGELPFRHRCMQSEFVGADDLSIPTMKRMEAAYKDALQNAANSLSNLFLLESLTQSHSVSNLVGLADEVYFSYPTPYRFYTRAERVIPKALQMLRSGGRFFLRTENTDYKAQMLGLSDSISSDGFSMSSGTFSEIPYSFYDYYLRSRPGTEIMDYCIIKK